MPFLLLKHAQISDILGIGLVDTLWNLSDYIVTQEIFAKERQILCQKIDTGDRSNQNQVLYLRKSILEKQIWDLDSRIDQLPSNDPNIQKWKTRLNRVEKEKKDVESQLQKTK